MSFDLHSDLASGLMDNGILISYPAEWYVVHNSFFFHSTRGIVALLVLSIVLILYDGFTRKRMDYIGSLLVGTVLWEGMLWAVSRSNEWEYTLRHYGCQFVIAMFLGDRAFDCLKGKQKRPFPWRRWLEFWIIVILMLLFDAYGIGFYRKSERTVGSSVVDRVAISSLPRVLLFVIVSILSIAFLLGWRRHRYMFRRAVGVCSFSFFFSLTEVLGAYWTNQYWVELGSFPDWVVLPSNGLLIVVMMYDILIERVLPTLCSYLLMVVFRILRDDHQDSYYNLPICKDHVLFPVSSFFVVCFTSAFSVFIVPNYVPLHLKHSHARGVGSYGWICRLSFREPKYLLIFCVFGSVFRGFL